MVGWILAAVLLVLWLGMDSLGVSITAVFAQGWQRLLEWVKERKK